MFKRIILVLMLILLGQIGLARAFESVKNTAPITAAKLDKFEPFNKSDRILILAPHPDDETIACGGVIQKALRQGAAVNVAYLTNGDHNEFAFIVYEKRLTFRKGEFIYMGRVRRNEAIRAMKVLGLKEEDLTFLGYPDFGTFRIFNEYWDKARPYRSILTRIASVPYRENVSYGAPYIGESIIKDLKDVILKFKPDKIFVSHPADTNPDHRALYLFLQVVLRDLDQNTIARPHVYTYLVHSAGWPSPRHYHPLLGLEPPEVLQNSQINWQRLDLSIDEIDKKHKAVLCYPSQTQSSAFYLLSFCRRSELFGDFPEIHLKRQISLREKAVSFFGFSDLYPYSDVDTLDQDYGFKASAAKISYAVLDSSLLIKIDKTEDFKQNINTLIYLFGYNKNTPFASMPKIRILIKKGKLKVIDGSKLIGSEEVSLNVSPGTVMIKVALKLLGDPEFILTSVKGYGGILSKESSGFRRIFIE